MKRTITLCLAAGLTTGALLQADTAAAQQLSYAISGTDRAVDPATLEARAAELYSSPKQYRRAAAFLMEAAELRAAADPMRVKNKSLAARLYYYDGDKDRARSLLEQAADDAIAAGDVVTAADLYLDASYVAHEEKDGPEVLRLAAKAKLLMSSPLVDARSRDRVLSRIAENV
ncbi:MAG: hypothetical protein ACRELX_11365 [Longimicrobiales bacterium]